MRTKPITAKEASAIEAIRRRWLVDEQVAQYEDAEIIATVDDILRLCALDTSVPVVVVDSPTQARLASVILTGLRDGLRESLSASLDLRASLYASLNDSISASLDASLRDGLRASLSASLRASLDDGLRESLNDSLDDGLDASLRDGLHASLRASLHASLRDGLSASLHASLRDGLRASISASLDDGLKDSLYLYCGVWWNPWAGWYEAAKILGTKYDREQYDLFTRFNRHCPVWMWCDRAIYILRRPHAICWNELERLHNESGPSVVWHGFGLWHVNGVHVDRQIVMDPQSQTIQQIENEKNEDVRSIRIERYGWHRYIRDTNAMLIDERENEIEGTREALYRTARGMRFVATCPSGGERIVALGVPDEITTCSAAQSWMDSDRRELRTIART